MSAMPKRDIEDFISRWSGATATERSVSQMFLVELCDLLDLPHPDNQRNGSYTFEFHVKEIQDDGTSKDRQIDLYKRACFVLESKKFEAVKPEQSQLELAAEKIGAVAKRKKSAAPVRDTDRWDDAMLKALGQAKRYKDALPPEEPNPPFLLVVDVGSVIEVRADFTLTGRAYQPFPDPLTYRIRLEQLRDEKIRERLKLIWTNPLELDPSKRSAEVTREVAKYLAELAKSFEKDGHPAKVVAEFLTRCLFCMFAEDVGLLTNADGKKGFSELLHSLPPDGTGFETMLRTLFKEMNEGRSKGNEVSVILRKKLLQFNGGIFADDTVLPVNGTQLGILKKAAEQDWQHVEPAIFGTLLERALGGEGERRKLGAHFTPRAYVERLVMPTVIEPLRAEWENVRAEAVTLGKRGDIAGARKAVNRFHDRLCGVRVLDPACGSGNFLYVALENLKRLEGEILDFGKEFGEGFKLEIESVTVDPHQFLGLEINPRAVSIAELVLWIGYLQWHFRTRGQTPPREPVLKKFDNIKLQDAVLAYDGEPKPARDTAGNVITVWDRRSKKTNMVTGREVPDETKRVPLLTYTNPRPAIWPDAEFIVGNPPFIGDKLMREELGDGYVETTRKTYPEVTEAANFVMYWWHKAAELVRASKARRFGLITTNAVTQTFNRRVLQTQLSAQPPLSLAFAIPDHPWVDTADGAAVRIAMTVGVTGAQPGDLYEVTNEQPQEDGAAKVSFKTKRGIISADLTIGANLTMMRPLKANILLNSNGMMLAGSGFIVTPDEASALGLGKIKGVEKHIRPYRNGKDLTDEPRGVMVIDLFGLSESEIRARYPKIYQHVLTNVKPERDANRRPKMRLNWWLFGEPRKGFRAAVAGLSRYIVTVETSKHRFFVFLDSAILPDHKLNVFALNDAFFLGVMSSRIHCSFALAAGSVLEDRPVYLQSRCFLPFPFPLCGETERKRIRKLAEELDAHRKRAQAQHGLTLTGLYNVLETIRSGETLTAKEKLIHDKGLVSVLKQLHDDLDAAVFAAYGWPANLSDAEILERLVTLNAERAAEEARGVIHWLRPDYQAKGQQEIVLENRPAKKSKAKAAPAKRKTKLTWPKVLAERVQAVETALHAAGAAVAPGDLAKQFARAKPADVLEILKTLETLGRARRAADGKFRP
jgi:SAM-dependent methyltransferase